MQSIPLISLDEFRFHVPLHYERGKPVKISRVRLMGIEDRGTATVGAGQGARD